MSCLVGYVMYILSGFPLFSASPAISTSMPRSYFLSVYLSLSASPLTGSRSE